MRIEIRDKEEIQRAHDMLVGILLGEVDYRVDKESLKIIAAAADVLCWVLMHDHNNTFEDNLNTIERELAKKGVFLVSEEK